MSVQELRARIEILSSEIELQTELFKTLLEKLERDKRLAQRQLNEAVDPVARLPLEISSEIFLQSVAVAGNFPAPTLLTSICSAWTTIALSTPTLWTTIHIDFPCAEGLTELLSIWFCRARNRPMSISISLRGHWDNWDHRVSDIIWQHGGQLKHLEMTDRGHNPQTDVYDVTNIDFFGGTTPAPLPLLIDHSLF
ncbi:hypothetical protein B0H12DRAFT_327182 [Mycena haematopus]|nr:hypothetical protein B0H12DRAFT_327182 [Mycena haematopus]